MSDHNSISWLATRATLLLGATLAIVAIPLLLLVAVPVGYFAEHAAFHAAWQTLVIAGGGVLALRAAIRWSRVPRDLVGTVILVGATVFSIVAFVALRETRAYLHFLVLGGALLLLALFNLLAFTRAWRAGWRPPEA
jgi:hypothetical protein